MVRREILIVYSTIFLAGFASGGEAASLNVSHGEVLLGHGTGYETVAGSADLLVGDTVLGKPGSAAQIAFADGCTISLGVGTVFRVATTSPCKFHSAGAGAWGATQTPDNGGWTSTVNENTGDWTNNPILPYVLSAGVIGGIFAVVESGGKQQASP
jgi:hypothetical protein